MQAVGAALRGARVKAIFLAHGSFLGPDAVRILAELARALPATGSESRCAIRRLFHEVRGETGDYTESYARLFESAINAPGCPQISVEIFHWSSENHHIGRADGAVRLIDRLASLDCEPGDRVLLWGHSHAGNVFALLSHLISGDPEAVERFFRAAEVYYRWPVLGWVDIPLWNRVCRLLLGGDSPLANLAIDIVTFGTPVGYGWDARGYSRLLHFIHRRFSATSPQPPAPLSVDLDGILSAAEGDYIQQLGAAGTNTVPSKFAWRAWLADRRLHALLQSRERDDEPMNGCRAGRILPPEGTTLLVDYGRLEGKIGEHMAGHAVYTRKRWLPFHAEEVVRRFYASRAAKVA